MERFPLPLGAWDGLLCNKEIARCLFLMAADIIEAFDSTSREPDYLLNIDSFRGMVSQIYPPELQLNKANSSDTEAPFFGRHLEISNGFVSSKIYDLIL